MTMQRVPTYLSDREKGVIGSLESDDLFNNLLRVKDQMHPTLRALAALQLPDTDYGLYFEMNFSDIMREMNRVPSPSLVNSLWVPLTLYSAFGLPSARSSYMIMSLNPSISPIEYANYLDPLSRTWVYADALAILDYYSYGNDMLPYSHKGTDRGFENLHSLMEPGIDALRSPIPPPIPFPHLQRLDVDPSDFVNDRNLSFLYFIVATDISWTIDLLKGFWDNMPIFIPFYIKNNQSINKFFDNYSSALSKVRDGKSMSIDEYITMLSILESDIFCYQRWLYGHKSMELMDASFVKEMSTFLNYLIVVTNMIKNYPCV